MTSSENRLVCDYLFIFVEEALLVLKVDYHDIYAPTTAPRKQYSLRSKEQCLRI